MKVKKTKKLNKDKKRIKEIHKNRTVVIIFTGVLLIIGTMAGFALTTVDEQPINQPVFAKSQKPEDPVATPQTVEEPKTQVEAKTDEKPAETSQWPVSYTLDQAASLTVVVNKKHKLPSNYAPTLKSVAGGQKMRPEAADALTNLFSAAQNAGVPIRVVSAYRSYDTQVATYNKWVSIDGKSQADRSSARPGHSEHQTGLAVDVGMPDASCDLDVCFGNTAQGKWLEAHAQDYGFIIRYESDTEAVTGYQYEPWHIRYLGVSTATAVKNSGQTLDQYY